MRFAVLPLLALGACVAAARTPSAAPAEAGTKGMVRVSTQGAPPEVLPVRVLAVGISDFQGLGAEDDLPTAEADARWFVDQLARVITPAEPPVVLTGKDATLAAVQSAITSILGGARRGEVVVMYLSTHGAKVHDAGYLLTWDSIPEGRLPATGLATRKIADAIAKTAADQVLVLADTVHQALSGVSGLTTGPDSDVDATMGGIAADARKAGRNVLVVTGSEARRPAPSDPCAGHGAFACTVVAALQGRADGDGDGVAGWSELATRFPTVFANAGGTGRASVWGTAAGLGMPVAPTVLATAPAPVSQAVWTTVPHDVRVCLLENDRVVGADQPFRTGDRFAARVSVPEAGYLSMVNVGPDGKAEVLFPLPGEDSRVGGGESVQVMPGTSPDPIVLVDPVGKERVYVLWSPPDAPLADEPTLLRVASARAASGGGPSDTPDPAWSTAVRGTKGLTRMPRVTQPATADPCNVYRPDSLGQGWVVELTLDHR